MTSKKKQQQPEAPASATKTATPLGPGVDAAYRLVRNDLSGRVESGELRKSLNEVLLGATPLDRAISELADDASDLVDRALAEGRIVTDREARLDTKLEAALVTRLREKAPRRARRARQGEYLVRGVVKDPRGGKPVAGLVVELVDRDLNVLEIDVTDSKGRYQIALTPDDIATESDEVPEVAVRVATSRAARPLIVTEATPLKLGRLTSLDVTLQKEGAGMADYVEMAGGRLNLARVGATREASAARQIEHQHLELVGAGLKNVLAAAARLVSSQPEDMKKEED